MGGRRRADRAQLRDVVSFAAMVTLQFCLDKEVTLSGQLFAKYSMLREEVLNLGESALANPLVEAAGSKDLALARNDEEGDCLVRSSVGKELMAALRKSSSSDDTPGAKNDKAKEGVLEALQAILENEGPSLCVFLKKMNFKMPNRMQQAYHEFVQSLVTAIYDVHPPAVSVKKFVDLLATHVFGCFQDR